MTGVHDHFYHKYLYKCNQKPDQLLLLLITINQKYIFHDVAHISFSSNLMFSSKVIFSFYQQFDDTEKLEITLEENMRFEENESFNCNCK